MPGDPYQPSQRTAKASIVTREIDEGKELARIGERLKNRGAFTSQRFHDWKRTEQVQADSTRGGGGTPPLDGKEDRQAARLAARWTLARIKARALVMELDYLMSAADAPVKPQEKHRTPAQVEADGWCGNHWHRIGEHVPITLRPTGEPYYAGLCRSCGRWPGGLPPVEVLQAWRDGRGVKVAAE